MLRHPGPFRTMASKRLEAQRANVLAKQKRASAKISRTKSKNGADIAGTEYDPRVPRERIGRMTARQLNALDEKLSRFNNRNTQFYGGVQGSIVTSKLMRQFRYAESQSNKNRAEWFERTKDMIGPSGSPLGKRFTMIDRKQRHHNAVNDPFSQVKAGKINGNAEVIKGRLEQLKDEATPGYDIRVGEKRRAEFTKMVDQMEVPDIGKALSGLTPRQFTTLWHFTDFANSLSLVYEAFSKGEDESFQNPDSVVSGELRHALEIVDWAKGTPE